jgi:hypothetical protein
MNMSLRANKVNSLSNYDYFHCFDSLGGLLVELLLMSFFSKYRSYDIHTDHVVASLFNTSAANSELNHNMGFVRSEVNKK